MGVPSPAHFFRFGAFQLDLRARELRRNGIKVRVPDQSIQALALLLEHPGEVVTREELHQRLWPNGTIVEFDHSINAAIKRLRQALEDSAEDPRYVETLPRLGYRFIGAVDQVPPAGEALPSLEPQASPGELEGEIVSHYRILGKIGSGGMGVVYRAQDTRLNRTVAIKILAEHLSDNPLVRDRFDREARAIASLSHPHICTLYDIGHQDGIVYLVMEYLEGETLAQRLCKGPLLLDQLLEFALQIADALEEAHQQGIIHRDLKPSNIMLTKSGAKLLDFGVAKRHRRATAASGDSKITLSSTISLTTGEESFIGTPAYMSPEQARGEELDARTDLFSFGSVLHEMASSKQAFSGSTPAALIDALENLIPTRVTQISRPSRLTTGLSAELDAIINKALQKDREIRYQKASDLVADLKRIKRFTDSGRATPRALKHPLAPWIAILFVVIASAAGWLLNTYPKASDPALTPIPLTSYPGYETNPSFSPDGNQVAFQWSRVRPDQFDIYIKLIGTSDPVRLTNSADSECPAWSPDGRSIAFIRASPDGRLGVFLIPAIGGAQRKLTELKNNGTCSCVPCLAWHPSGKWLVVSDNEGPEEPLSLFSLAIETGEKQRLTRPSEKLGFDMDPAVSPDGKSLVFARFRDKGGSELYLLDTADGLVRRGEPKQLTFEKKISDEPVWTPDGHTILFSSGSAQSPSLYKLEPVAGRKPERLMFSGEGAASPAFSRQGRLAYAIFSFRANIWQLPLAGPGYAPKPTRRLIASTRLDHTPQFSPDGKRIAFASNRSGSHEIWVSNSDGSGSIQLTFFGGSFYTASPRWSPDGRWIMFHSRPEGRANAYLISSDGGRPVPIRIMTKSISTGPNGWSHDGRWVYLESDITGRREIWRAPWSISGHIGEGRQITRKGGLYAQESPDGRFIYYLKDEKENSSVWRVPVEGGDETQILQPRPCRARICACYVEGAVTSATPKARIMHGVPNILSSQQQ